VIVKSWEGIAPDGEIHDDPYIPLELDFPLDVGGRGRRFSCEYLSSADVFDISATLAKYHDQIEAEKDSITTYASSMDPVHGLFTSVAGRIVHFSAPGLPPSQVFNNHCPYYVLEPVTVIGPDGQPMVVLRERPVVDQSPIMVAMSQLVDFLGKFMSASSFAALADLAMSFEEDPRRVTGYDVFDWPGVMRDFGSGQFNPLDLFSKYVKEPYKATFTELLRLCGAFYQDGGMTAAQGEAVNDFLYMLLYELLGPVKAPFVWPFVGEGESKLGALLAAMPYSPYSAVVRDFSQETEDRLCEMAYWFQLPDFGMAFKDVYLRPRHLDFHADDAARRAYYESCIRGMEMTVQQVHGIFDGVRAADVAYAAKVAGMTEQARAGRAQLEALSYVLESLVG